jgi:hypothetical protein
MPEKFKNKIKTLREIHFPGRSVRGLRAELEPHFGEHYYAYISKFELGVLPTIEALEKFNKAYNLSAEEYTDLMETYLVEKFEDHIADAQRIGVSVELRPEPILFRKVSKKKKS